MTVLIGGMRLQGISSEGHGIFKNPQENNQEILLLSF